MIRPRRDEALMETAFLWSRRSTCDRLHVGCVVHREGRILVQGYNGAPAGLTHCDHICTCTGPLEGFPHDPKCNSLKPCIRAVHAEQNSIAYAARWGVELQGAEMSCTHQPCMSCAQSIINAGIVAVSYVYPYRLADGVNLLHEAGIRVEVYLDWEEPKLIGSVE